MKKNVIITGATGNLGKATVATFIRAGYNVIATVSPGKSLPIDPTGDLETVEADLRNEGQVDEVINQIIIKHKTIDGALLLAGGFVAGGIKAADGESIKKMYEMNFETAYFAIRPVFLQMQKQPAGGRIVLVGSRPALIPKDGKNVMAYALSKSLLITLAEYLNAEGASQNVVTSVIVPSIIDTPANRQSMPKADFSKWVKAEEIAEIMEFICSQKADSVREPVYKVYGNT
jgi:NAD(P)-dependent dehydrogenase (short-subunit alcohol dehydrogenase family)